MLIDGRFKRYAFIRYDLCVEYSLIVIMSFFIKIKFFVIIIIYRKHGYRACHTAIKHQTFVSTITHMILIFSV